MRKIVLTFVLTLAVISGLFAESKVVCYKETGIGTESCCIDVVDSEGLAYVRICNTTNRTVRVHRFKTLTEATLFYVKICDDYWTLKANLLDSVKKEDVADTWTYTFPEDGLYLRGTFVFLLLNDSNNINGRK